MSDDDIHELTYDHLHGLCNCVERFEGLNKALCPETGKSHEWARRRDGRWCPDCGIRDYGDFPHKESN